MPATSLLLPVFVQVLLTYAVLISLGIARGRSLREAGVRRSDPSLTKGTFTWSETATKVSNNFKNQFELPVLFYVGVAFALILKQTDVVLVGLAWVFAVSRLIHAYAHIGPNFVPVRGSIYFIGAVALLAFWITLLLRVLGGAGAG